MRSFKLVKTVGQIINPGIELGVSGACDLVVDYER
jgi:hypothetical protein